MFFKDVPFEFKAEDLEKREITAYSAGIGNIDDGGDLIYPGAFDKWGKWFIDYGFIANQHNWRDPIGKPLEQKEVPNHWWTRQKLSEVPSADNVYTLIKDKVIQFNSIGYDIEKYFRITAEMVEAGDDEVLMAAWAKATPKQQQKALNWGYGLQVLKVYESSPVTVPMNSETPMLGVKSLLLANASLEELAQLSMAANDDLVRRYSEVFELAQKDGKVSQARKDRVAAHIPNLEKTLSTLRALLDDAPARFEKADSEGMGKAKEALAIELEFKMLVNRANLLTADIL